MMIHRILTGLGLLGGLSLAAAADAQTVTAQAFDAFVQDSAPICERKPAARCIDAGWRFADTDADGELSLSELQTVHGALQGWLARKSADIAPQERMMISLGLGLIDAAGLRPLMDSFDVDRNELISRPELLADIQLDERPLGEILLDPKSVDRTALARRLGVLAPLLGPLLAGPRD